MAKTKTITKYRTFKAHRRHRNGKTLPLAVLLGFAPLVTSTLTAFKNYGPEGAAKHALCVTSGYDPTTGKWEMLNMKQGALPILAGFATHWLAGKLGVNRALGRAGVPFIRI